MHYHQASLLGKSFASNQIWWSCWLHLSLCIDCRDHYERLHPAVNSTGLQLVQSYPAPVPFSWFLIETWPTRYWYKHLELGRDNRILPLSGYNCYRWKALGRDWWYQGLSSGFEVLAPGLPTVCQGARSAAAMDWLKAFPIKDALNYSMWCRHAITPHATAYTIYAIGSVSLFPEEIQNLVANDFFMLFTVIALLDPSIISWYGNAQYSSPLRLCILFLFFYELIAYQGAYFFWFFAK